MLQNNMLRLKTQELSELYYSNNVERGTNITLNDVFLDLSRLIGSCISVLL